MNPSDPIVVFLEKDRSVWGIFECSLDNGRILVNVPHFKVTITPRKQPKRKPGEPREELPPEVAYTEIGRRDAEFKYIDEKWQLMCYRRQAA